MISSISWVPRGAAKAIPEVAVPVPPSTEEIEELLKSGLLEQSHDEESEEDEEEEEEEMDVDASKKADEVANALSVANALRQTSEPPKSLPSFEDITDGLKELDMDNYDEEEADVEVFSSGIGNIYYPSNDMDPYLKDKNDEDSDELEDKEIKPTDSVIVCARTDDGYHALEVYVFEELDDGETNLFVHQEVTISEFPLCTAWLDCPLNGGEKGNFVAVGSMEPAIEIWDLDVIEPEQACLVLGGEEEVKKKKKKSKKKASIKYKEGSHTDSVLGLAWNKEYRNVLASASADRQVKIWDVSTGKCSSTMEHHTDKVQAVAWNHKSPHLILSGSFDHTIVMRDLRSNSGAKCSVTADVESLAWNPHSELSFVVCLEDGTIKGFDIRAASDSSSYTAQSTFTLHAHDKAVSSVSYNPSAPNLLATGSTDKTVKLWDLSNNKPSCIASRSPKLGALFSVSFSDDRPFLLAMGGSKGKLEIWDTLMEATVSQRFGRNVVAKTSFS